MERCRFKLNLARFLHIDKSYLGSCVATYHFQVFSVSGSIILHFEKAKDKKEIMDKKWKYSKGKQEYKGPSLARTFGTIVLVTSRTPPPLGQRDGG